MIKWFISLSDRTSLKAKLFLLVGFVLVGLVTSTVLAQIIISRVQIGGRNYTGIELKTSYVGRLVRARSDLNLISSMLKSLTMDYEESELEPLQAGMQRFDTAMAGLTHGLTATAGSQSAQCTSCHAREITNKTLALLAPANEAWAGMKEIISGTILPALAAAEEDDAISSIEGEYDDRYMEIMAGTRAAVEEMRSSLEVMKQSVKKETDLLTVFYTVGGIMTIIVTIIFAYLFVRMLVGTINRSVTALEENAEKITNESDLTATSSNQLADMASQMAASLEETSASLEEISSMVQQNDANSGEANSATKKNDEISCSANKEMEAMLASMQNIKSDSDAIAGIIKEIEGIAFQTNLLALNAAVEAARAGDHGLGFAVVADEVRSLAQRTANSARKSSELLEQAIGNVNDGLDRVGDVAKGMQASVDGSRKVSSLVEEIAGASHEQAQGISQINVAVTEMDNNTQALAANSEELAAAATSVQSHTVELLENVNLLTQLVDGKKAADAA